MSCCLNFNHKCSQDLNATETGLISTGKYSCHFNILWNNMLAAVMRWPPHYSVWLFQDANSRDLSRGNGRRNTDSVRANTPAPIPCMCLAGACIFQAWNLVSEVGGMGRAEEFMEQVLARQIHASSWLHFFYWLASNRKKSSSDGKTYTLAEILQLTWIDGMWGKLGSGLSSAINLYCSFKQGSCCHLVSLRLPFKVELLFCLELWSKNKVWGTLMNVLVEMEKC